MKRWIKRILLILIVGFAVLLLFNSKSFSQATHNQGSLYANFSSSLLQHNNWTWGDVLMVDFPANNYRRHIMIRWGPLTTAKELIYAAGSAPVKNATGAFQTQGESVVDKFLQTRRVAAPLIIIDGQDYSVPFYGTINSALKEDIMSEWWCHTFQTLNVIWHRQLSSFANRYHDNYFLISHDVGVGLDLNNDGVDDMPEQDQQIFFDDTWGWSLCEEGYRSTWTTSYNGIGAWHECRFFPSKLMEQGKIAKRSRDSLLVMLTYDADLDRTKKPLGFTGTWPLYDDEGDPDPYTGEFLSPMYVGQATFYADKSATNKTDDIGQPYSTDILWAGNRTEYYAKAFDQNMGIGGQIQDSPVRQQQYSLRTFPREDVLYNVKEPNQLNKYHMLMNHGPYTMKKGQTFSFTYALGAAMISKDLCVTEGAKWLSVYKSNPTSAALTAANTAKNNLLRTGLDSILQTMDRAYWAYTKNKNIDDPPPTPDINVASGADKIVITWGYRNANNYKDADTGVDDFKEWRLYRKRGEYQIDALEDVSKYYPYELIGVFPKSVTSYEDKNVVRGVKYHYCITAVDEGSQNKNGLIPGPLESSYFENRTVKEAVPFKAPVESSANVVIVPNPYSVSTGISNLMNYPGAPNDIRFMNLPPYCTLKVYTSTGDLVKTFEHTSGTGDEVWTGMRTETNQLPVSGVYILAVDNAKDSNKNPLPRNIYKFVIVR